MILGTFVPEKVILPIIHSSTIVVKVT